MCQAFRRTARLDLRPGEFLGATLSVVERVLGKIAVAVEAFAVQVGRHVDQLPGDSDGDGAGLGERHAVPTPVPPAVAERETDGDERHAGAAGQVNRARLHDPPRPARAVGGDRDVDHAALSHQAAERAKAPLAGGPADNLPAEHPDDLGDQLAVRVVADKGYAATSVADVLAAAGVSRKSFYEHFANKAECFLEAYDDGVDRVLRTIEDALERETDAFALAATGVGAYLGWLVANPAFARTFVLEALAAGPAALARRAAVHERFADHFAQVYAAAQTRLPELGELPAYRFRACVGATDALVLEHVRVHGPATLEELAGPMFDVIVGLLVGHDKAARLAGAG